MAILATCADRADAQPATTKAVAFSTFEGSNAEHGRVLAPFIAKHCGKCHNAKTTEGELDLAALDPDMKASTSAGRWAMVQKMLATFEMPPAERARPRDVELKAVTERINAEMKREGKHFARREASANGNKVNHDKLFAPKLAVAFDNPTQLRRLSPKSTRVC